MFSPMRHHECFCLPPQTNNNQFRHMSGIAFTGGFLCSVAVEAFVQVHSSPAPPPDCRDRDSTSSVLTKKNGAFAAGDAIVRPHLPLKKTTRPHCLLERGFLCVVSRSSPRGTVWADDGPQGGITIPAAAAPVLAAPGHAEQMNRWTNRTSLPHDWKINANAKS